MSPGDSAAARRKPRRARHTERSGLRRRGWLARTIFSRVLWDRDVTAECVTQRVCRGGRCSEVVATLLVVCRRRTRRCWRFWFHGHGVVSCLLAIKLVCCST